jgi:hypothetical protein
METDGAIMREGTLAGQGARAAIGAGDGK